MSFLHAGRYVEAILDPNGLLLKNNPVWVYEVGTMTPAAVYSDKNRASALIQPLTTSAIGDLAFFADPGDYDLALIINGVIQPSLTITVEVDPLDITSSGLVPAWDWGDWFYVEFNGSNDAFTFGRSSWGRTIQNQGDSISEWSTFATHPDDSLSFPGGTQWQAAVNVSGLYLIEFYGWSTPAKSGAPVGMLTGQSLAEAYLFVAGGATPLFSDVGGLNLSFPPMNDVLQNGGWGPYPYLDMGPKTFIVPINASTLIDVILGFRRDDMQTQQLIRMLVVRLADIPTSRPNPTI